MYFDDSSSKSIREWIYNKLPTCWTISYILPHLEYHPRYTVTQRRAQANYYGLTYESPVNQRNFERCPKVTASSCIHIVGKSKGLHTKILTYT